MSQCQSSVLLVISLTDCSSWSRGLPVHIYHLKVCVLTEPVDLVVVKHEALLRQTERTGVLVRRRRVRVTLALLGHPGLAVRLLALLTTELVTLLGSHQVTPTAHYWSELKIFHSVKLREGGADLPAQTCRTHILLCFDQSLQLSSLCRASCNPQHSECLCLRGLWNHSCTAPSQGHTCTHCSCS